MQTTPPMARTVHLFLPPGMADWEPGFAVAAINEPPPGLAQRPYRVRTVGLSGDAITTLGGMKIVPDMRLRDLRADASAMLILPGASSWDRGENGETVDLARSFLGAGVPVAAICGATFALAKGGLLDDRSHTSAAPEYLNASGYRGGAHYRRERAVTDRGLVTAGPTAPIEFAKHILALLELFTPPVLDAWYGLYTTGDPRFHATLMAAAETAASHARG